MKARNRLNAKSGIRESVDANVYYGVREIADDLIPVANDYIESDGIAIQYDEENKLDGAKEDDCTLINIVSTEESGHNPKIFIDAVITNQPAKFSGNVINLSFCMEEAEGGGSLSGPAHRVDIVAGVEHIVAMVGEFVANAGEGGEGGAAKAAKAATAAIISTPPTGRGTRKRGHTASPRTRARAEPGSRSGSAIP